MADEVGRLRFAHRGFRPSDRACFAVSPLRASIPYRGEKVMANAQEIMKGLSQPQLALLSALDSTEFRNWLDASMPGTKVTRDRIAHLTEAGERPWFRRLTDLGAQVVLAAKSRATYAPCPTCGGLGRIRLEAGE